MPPQGWSLGPDLQCKTCPNRPSERFASRSNYRSILSSSTIYLWGNEIRYFCSDPRKKRRSVGGLSCFARKPGSGVSGMFGTTASMDSTGTVSSVNGFVTKTVNTETLQNENWFFTETGLSSWVSSKL